MWHSAATQSSPRSVVTDVSRLESDYSHLRIYIVVPSIYLKIINPFSQCGGGRRRLFGRPESLHAVRIENRRHKLK